MGEFFLEQVAFAMVFDQDCDATIVLPLPAYYRLEQVQDPDLVVDWKLEFTD